MGGHAIKGHGGGVVVSAGGLVDRETGVFSHEAALYRGDEQFCAAVLPFVRDGVARGEPVLVALHPRRLELLERALGTDAVRVDFVDMSELGANPACIIPEWHRFLEDAGDDGPVRGVGEPVWSGRRAVELDEAELHEGLLNLAFDGGPPWRLLCSYDVMSLPAEVVDEVLRNHPRVHGGPAGEVGYAGYQHAREVFAAPLPAAPRNALVLTFDLYDLVGVRRLVRSVCRDLGIDSDRADNLTLAAHELATNSVVHAGGRGRLLVWREPDALVVEVHDGGLIDDPLVGRTLLDLHSESGRGIWIANQLCDLVQVRSGSAGTQVRLRAWL